MLVLIVGYACTGKSTLRKRLEESGVLAIEASSFIAPLREACEKNCIESIYEVYPKDIGARLIEERYGRQLEHSVVVGLRTMEEYSYFRTQHPVKLISLQASLVTCYARSCARSNREHFDSLEVFYQQRIASDNALGLADLLAQAKDTLWNECLSEDEFFQYASKIITPLL